MKLIMTFHIDETFRNLKKKNSHALYSIGVKEKLFLSIRRSDLLKSLTRKIWADKRSYAI